MSKESLRLQSERFELLWRLRREVDLAYSRRVVEVVNMELMQSEERMVEARNLGMYLNGLADDEPVNDLSSYSIPRANTAFVFMRSEYEDLLRIAFMRISEGGRPVLPETIESRVQSTLRHEFEHAKPLESQRGVLIYYSVDFIEDQNTGKVFAAPHIHAEGATAGVMRQAFAAVVDPSPSDQIVLNAQGI